MKKQSNNFCVILAGGRGLRLWPSSRQECPKQFLDFFGTGRTQLQATFDRFAAFILAENIYVTVSAEHEHLVREQLPELPAENVLVEPVNRNTAPSVAWAGRRIHGRCDDARIVVTPSDQFVLNETAFREDVLEGLDFVGDNDVMLTMGIRPSRPEPGYGYIQIGEPTIAKGIHKVHSFTEKPDRDFARVFMDSGEFFWNTGMFITCARHLREFFLKVMPDMPYRLACLPFDKTIDEELAYVREHFPSYPNLSMDQAALELADNVYVMRCNFGWADMGTWHSIYEFMQRSEDDNVVLDSEVMMEHCRGNIVKLPKGHIGVFNGLEGFIVAEEGDVLLICPKGDSSSLIKKYASEVGIKYGERYI
jgi:mannose-1-phosphate guanylyltransferase